LLATLFISIVAILIATALVNYAAQRRLYVVVPRLFPHSRLSDEGHAAELTIINRGPFNEEDVTIEINSKINFEIIASTSPSVIVKKSIISIARIPKGDEVSFVFNVEGGDFSYKSIGSISSKNCRGKVVEKLENVPVSFGNFVSAIVIIMFLCVTMAFIGYMVRDTNVFSIFDNEQKSDDHSISADSSSLNSEKLNYAETLSSIGWENFDRYLSSAYFLEIERPHFPVEITSVRRQGSVVLVDISLDNQGSDIMYVDASVRSPVDGRLPQSISARSSYYGIMVVDQSTSERQLAAFLPEDHRDQILVVHVNITYGSDTVYRIRRLISVSN